MGKRVLVVSAAATGTIIGGVGGLAVSALSGVEPSLSALIAIVAALIGAVGGVLGAMTTILLGHTAEPQYRDFLLGSIVGGVVTYLIFFARQDSLPPAAMVGLPALIVAFAMYNASSAGSTVRRRSAPRRLTDLALGSAASVAGCALTVFVAVVYVPSASSAQLLPGTVLEELVNRALVLALVTIAISSVVWFFAWSREPSVIRNVAIAAICFGGVAVQVGWLAAPVSAGLALASQIDPPPFPLILIVQVFAWASLLGGLATLVVLARTSRGSRIRVVGRLAR